MLQSRFPNLVPQLPTLDRNGGGRAKGDQSTDDECAAEQPKGPPGHQPNRHDSEPEWEEECGHEVMSPERRPQTERPAPSAVGRAASGWFAELVYELLKLSLLLVGQRRSFAEASSHYANPLGLRSTKWSPENSLDDVSSPVRCAGRSPARSPLSVDQLRVEVQVGTLFHPGDRVRNRCAGLRPLVLLAPARGLQQVEHESLMLLEGERGGASVPDLIGWGRGDSGDALVVTARFDAPRLQDLGNEEVTERQLAQCWEALTRLHEAGIAHRAIDRLRIVVLDERVVLDDLSSALNTPDEITQASDVAQMLVATAVAVGADRAIQAALGSVGDERLASAVPLLQRAALPASLQRDAKDEGVKIKDLRAAVAEATESDEGELVQLARVTTRNLVMVVLTVVAANALISALADIGFDTIVDELSNASWEWVLAALILAQLTNIGEYVALRGWSTARCHSGRRSSSAMRCRSSRSPSRPRPAPSQ